MSELAMRKWLIHPVTASFFALIIYGSWAAFANIEFGFPIATKSFIGQGLYAFCSTMFLSAIALTFYNYFGNTLSSVHWTLAICLVAMGLLPLIIHSIIDTPNIIKSILPGFLWGSAYVYFLLLSHHNRSKK